MLFDDSIMKALAECEKYLSTSHHGTESQAAAMEPILKAMNSVLAAARLTMFDPKMMVALEIFKAHKEVVGNLRQVTKLSIGQDGKLIREDLLTCPNECCVAMARVYETELLDVLNTGVSAKKLVENMKQYLTSPEAGFGTVVGKQLPN